VAAAEARQRDAERHEQFRREATARELEEERRALLPLLTLVISPNESIASEFQAVVRTRFPEAETTTVTNPEAANVQSRLDGVLLDASMPDWAGVRAVDWVQECVATDCIGIVVRAPADERVWNLLRGRGVHRIADVEKDTGALLDAAEKRNLA